MIGGNSRAKTRKPATLQSTRLPAPQLGIDSRVPLSDESLKNCTYTYNLLPYDDGMKLRKGAREWQIDVNSTISTAVNSIVPFDGIEENGVEDKLFAVTNEGIWDVTTAGGTPVSKYTFLVQSSFAGHGVHLHYVSDAGTDVLFYADSANGLFTYDSSTDTWALATGITGGPNMADIRFVMVHKQRIWVIAEGDTSAYYLPVGAIAGVLTKFSFGSKLPRGGALRGLFSWSVDGGAGVDDMLVGVGRAGDVIVYQGDDPSSSTTWGLKGVYFIGALPEGYTFGTEHGGELFLLSTYGITGMNDLLKGASAIDTGTSGAAGNIAALIRTQMLRDRDNFGWRIATIPSEGGLLVQAPVSNVFRPIQYYYNVAVKGWGLWRDLRMTSFATWRGGVVFGDDSNRVMYMDVEADEVLLNPAAGVEINGVPIEFSILGSYSSLGAPTAFKRISYIRPDFVGKAPPSFATVMRFDYEAVEASKPVYTQIPLTARWDLANWDISIWGSDSVSGYGAPFGGWGMGRYGAVAMRGASYETFRLAGWDVHYEVGGVMV